MKTMWTKMLVGTAAIMIASVATAQQGTPAAQPESKPAAPAQDPAVKAKGDKADKAKGVKVTMEPTEPRPGIRIAFIRGPENISIEILERFPV